MTNGMVQTYLAEFKMVEENVLGYKTFFLLAITQDRKRGETYHLLGVAGKHKSFMSVNGEDLITFVESYRVV